MSSSCISSCVNDARIPVRATYVNVYKWPESDAEFVRSVSNSSLSNSSVHSHRGVHSRGCAPRVVDSISCRQMYLRSYTFSKKETVQERTKKSLGKIKEKVSNRRKKKVRGGGDSGGRKCVRSMRKVKAALFSIFHRLLSCAASVDVVDRGRL